MLRYKLANLAFVIHAEIENFLICYIKYYQNEHTR